MQFALILMDQTGLTVKEGHVFIRRFDRDPLGGDVRMSSVGGRGPKNGATVVTFISTSGFFCRPLVSLGGRWQKSRSGWTKILVRCALRWLTNVAAHPLSIPLSNEISVVS